VKLLSVERRTYHAAGRWRYVFAEVEIEGRRINVVIPHLYPFAFGTATGQGRHDIRTTARRLAYRITATTHWHLREGTELLRLVGTFRDPTILLGDFNTAPDHPIHWNLRRHLTDCLNAAGKGLASTYTFFLPVRIDYVYATKSIPVHAASVVPTTASDHRPVVALLGVPSAGE
jgi:endonuclease/exonuclease/phosphatase (EEP) superfamily protein YafD